MKEHSKAFYLALNFVAVALGLALGIGAFTYLYAEGSSYLTDDPAACANCHVMQEQYNGWLKGGHGHVAVCNDCHTPKGIVPKYTTKAINGFWHSFYFTTGDFPEPIQIRERNRQVTEGACRACHAPLVHMMQANYSGEPVPCLQCHAHVGHP